MVKQARVDVSSITGIAFSPQYRSYQRGFFDPSFQCQVEVAVLEDLIKGGETAASNPAFHKLMLASSSN